MSNYCTDNTIFVSLPVTETTTRRSTPLFSLSGLNFPTTVVLESDKLSTEITVYLYLERCGQVLLDGPKELQPDDSFGIIIDINSLTEDTNLTLVNQNCNDIPVMTINLYKVTE